MTSRKISSKNPPSKLDIEAGHWLLRLLDPEPEPDDPHSDPAVRHEAFLDWLATSPQHVRVFLETFETYRRLGHVDSLGLINIPALLREAADAPPRVRGTAEQQARPSARSPLGIGRFFRSSKIARWATGAAVIVLFLADGWPLFGIRKGAATPLVYSTAVGERKMVSLPEGTVLTLNTASRVEVTIDRRLRSVRLLEGEVLVAVHHEWARPFEVITKGVKVEDLGTEFDVYRRLNGVRVTVIEGHVRVLSDHGSITQDESQLPANTALSAGEQADISTESKPAAITTRRLTGEQVQEVMAWKEGKMYFHAELLRDVVDEFNRYNTRHLIIADPQIATLPVGGVFATPDADRLVEALHETWGIEVLPPDPSNADPETIRLGPRTTPSRQPRVPVM